MDSRIGAHELFHRLHDDEVLIIDCRTETDWTQTPVHVPGALRMSLEEIGEAAHILPDDELIVLCGADAQSEDALQAWRILRLRGRASVCLVGGLAGWVGEGFPVEQHVPGERRQRLQAVGLA